MSKYLVSIMFVVALIYAVCSCNAGEFVKVIKMPTFVIQGMPAVTSNIGYKLSKAKFTAHKGSTVLSAIQEVASQSGITVCVDTEILRSKEAQLHVILGDSNCYTELKNSASLLKANILIYNGKILLLKASKK